MIIAAKSVEHKAPKGWHDLLGVPDQHPINHATKYIRPICPVWGNSFVAKITCIFRMPHRGYPIRVGQ